MASRKDNRGRVLEKNEYQRANGSYRYDYQDAIGNKHSVYAPDLATLRDKEKMLTLSTWQGVDVERGNTLTINDLFERYMSTKVGLKHTTYASYLDMYGRYVQKEFGRRLVKNVKYSDIQAFYSYMISELNISIRTVEHLHMVLHPMFEMAIEDGLILKNPTKGMIGKLKKATGYQPIKRHALTINQQRKLLEFLDGNPTWGRYHSICKVMLGTGLRVGELAGLRWEDVDFENRIININHQVVCVRKVEGVKDAHIAISKPKSVAGIRNVPITGQVMEAFKEEYRYASGRGFPSQELEGYTDFIFTNQIGKVYTSSRLDRAFTCIVRDYNNMEEALAKAEDRVPEYLPKFSCHILRHTFCSRLCERDINPKVIQTVMGHASIKITMDIYAEVSEKKQREEIEKMANELDIF